MSDFKNSRISGLYQLSPAERRAELVRREFLTEEDAAVLADPDALGEERADSMIENVIGTFQLPIGVGVNFVVNGDEHVVPMVVEEPSIVAAVSHVASIVRKSGGFRTETSGSTMIAQVQVTGVDDLEAAADAVEAATEELLDIANTREPGMKRRGGGANGLVCRLLRDPEGSRFRDMLVVHLHVDCRDAMGANVVNTMAEAIAPRIEELTGGAVFLRILSNLAHLRLASATCRIAFEHLAWKDFEGAAVADGVVRASEFAVADPWRAATHNKGIMNGIDAVAIATGQDWRAIEAGAHAYVGVGHGYDPMAVWHVEDEHLVGEIEIPMAVGTVGGPIRLHPTVGALLRLLNVRSAGELGGILAAVGLAQNLGALKALGTQGIQRGHMSLHARSVAATAGARGDEVRVVAESLIEGGDIKVEVATKLLEALRTAGSSS